MRFPWQQNGKARNGKARNGKPKRRPPRRRPQPPTQAEVDAARIHELESQVSVLEAEKKLLERTRDFAFKQVELTHKQLEYEQALTDRKTADQMVTKPRKARP